MSSNTVYVVHNVDTEGPLHESLEATFGRIQEMTGFNIEATDDNLKKIKEKQIDLGGNEEKILRMLSDNRINTFSTWDQIDAMLDRITSTKFREKIKDSMGGGWIYNWLCMSHVGFTGINPRRRDLGYYKIHDHYKKYFENKNDYRDLIQWHYHSLSITNDAHRCGSTYLNSSHIYDILTRGIIDKSWFPSVFRAGHVTIRPDSHFFLEQWIPFDFSNTNFNKELNPEMPSRFGDWRKAPKSWIPYHPSHDDHQSEGSCKRYIARCAPINERSYSINIEDVEQAFEEALNKGSSILSVTNHDFRDMEPDVEYTRNLLLKCKEKYPNVKFIYSNAINAMRATFKMNKINEIEFDIYVKKYKSHAKLIIESNNDIFGSQPFFALKTKNDQYYWQNLDFESKNVWSYSFDAYNLHLSQVDEIGIAANTVAGLSEIINFDPKSGVKKKTILNK